MYHFGLRMGKRWFPRCYALVFRYRMYAKYLASGCIGAATDLLLLIAFTEVIGLHYMVSVVLAFIITFFVSFTLHKFWTFRDGSFDGIHGQAFLYFALATFNLVLNSLLVYFFAEIVALRMLGFQEVIAPIYLLAQALASIILALESFFMSKYVIFKNGKYNKPTQ